MAECTVESSWVGNHPRCVCNIDRHII